MRLRFAGTTVGLALALTAAIVIAVATGSYLYASHHFQTLLDSARDSALAKGELIRAALEHQMMEKDRSLIAGMIESFGRQRGVDRVVLLDRFGKVRYSGGPQSEATDLRIGSPTCQACHRYPPEQRGPSRVIETRGGTVLRTVVPIRNHPQCHRCHAPDHRINGILILDHNTEEMKAAMTRDLRRMIAGTGAMTLVLVGAISLVIYLLVLRRLRRFETAAREIARGDLNRRVEASGNDTLSWLAREFNGMADSMVGLIGEVRRQRERLETVINSIGDGIVVLDADRRIVAANDAFLDRAGHARTEVVGCSCRELAQGACTVGDCPSLACLESGTRQVRICERRTANGAAAWEEVHASPIIDAAGTLTHVVEVWRDISGRRAAEARLAESHRLASLGMLASGFSHELSTPLATVLTCVEGILRDLSDAQRAEMDLEHTVDCATTAREQILRCRGITQHFLRMSRDQRSPGEIVELSSAIDTVERLIEPTARAHSVRIEVQPVEPGLHVRADQADLQHALINLILNAIQACKPGGAVVVSAAQDETVHIRVADDGCGIPSEHLKRIFEPFFSLRSGGTGLGLFLSLNFLRRWGGDILVQSSVGKGSQFELVFPGVE